jgi:hypothetical protein
MLRPVFNLLTEKLTMLLKPARKDPGHLPSFALLLLGCAVTSFDHTLGGHIVVLSLIILQHQLLKK